MISQNIYKLHQLIKNKKISSIELTKECLNLAKRSENNSFIYLAEEMALKQASLADEEFTKNSFISLIHGIPYSLKDLFITKDIKTTAGSKILLGYIPPYDGFISKTLNRANGILIGKTNLDEFGMGSTTENSAYGLVKNPLNAKKVAGGSSGGSAASIVEGSCFFSMGTDTGGSSRVPANFCGIVGFKPSYGRVSRYGQIAHASSLDQASPMGKSTLDIACVMEQITAKDKHDGMSVDFGNMKIVNELLLLDEQFLKRKKIGVSLSLIEGCSFEVRRELNRALKHLQKMGCELIDVDFPHLKFSLSVYQIISSCEASSNLSRYDGVLNGKQAEGDLSLEDKYLTSRSQGFGLEVKKRILFGTFSLSSENGESYYLKACKVRRLIANDFREAFNECDILFFPVCASVASDIGLESGSSIEIYRNDYFTVAANLAGLPAIALPFGKDAEGMPTGFQFIGKQFRDEDLLKMAHAFEVSTGRINAGGQ